MIATPGNPPEPSSTTFKILLVDEAAADRQVLVSFTDAGKQFEVIKFLLGESLFTYLQQIDPSSYPNVIVLDRVSGTLSAFDILQKLKNDPKYVHIPVIIHSSILSAELKAELLKDGAEEFTESGSVMEAVKKFIHQLNGRNEFLS